jgi:hypothetical protein
MLYEVEITARIYVSVEAGGEEAARRLVQDHVCNDWLLQSESGGAKDSGHYAIKGLSGVATSTKPWIGNRKMKGGSEEDEDARE